MAERKLEGPQTGRQRQELMTEADAEHGNAAEQLVDGGDLGDERVRVSRPVREQNAVELGERVGIHVVGKHGDGGPSAASRRRIERLTP